MPQPQPTSRAESTCSRTVISSRVRVAPPMPSTWSSASGLPVCTSPRSEATHHSWSPSGRVAAWGRRSKSARIHGSSATSGSGASSSGSRMVGRLGAFGAEASSSRLSADSRAGAPHARDAVRAEAASASSMVAARPRDSKPSAPKVGSASLRAEARSGWPRIKKRVRTAAGSEDPTSSTSAGRRESRISADIAPWLSRF